MKLFDDQLISEACQACRVSDMENASIGETLLVANYLENKTGVKVIRMDQGSPSLPANKIGIEAEKRALDRGVANTYPAAGGVKELKNAASRFIKAFMNIDIKAEGCIPTTGSVEATFASYIATTLRIPGKDKVLFIDPGFPIQKAQMRILGKEWITFDIFNYRGKEKLKARIEKELKRGDIATIVYSNPNNPAWICLEEEELEAIGELATQYDVIVMEDLAYFCMDYRKQLGKPFQEPYVPTVARYTDNYILILSASKIFSYAGQRVALCCVSDALFGKQYPCLAERFKDAGIFGQTLTASILYMITSGCTASTQYGYAEMLDKSCDGLIDFVEDTREYERRSSTMKEIFLSQGFNIVYNKDITEKVGDGFFFSLGYKDMPSGKLARELMSYGISAINLITTGSEQKGVRVCCSRVTPDQFELLRERVKEFVNDQSI